MYSKTRILLWREDINFTNTLEGTSASFASMVRLHYEPLVVYHFSVTTYHDGHGYHTIADQIGQG